MKLSSFNFTIPKDGVALYPAKNRDESKLMIIDRKTGKIEHKKFHQIINYFGDGDVMILNNTKVFPARLYGTKEKTGAKIEVFLLRELNAKSFLWDVLVDPARKIRVGNKLYFGENDELIAEVVDNTTSRGRTIRFLFDGEHDKFKKILYGLGETPLPKYIKRPVEPMDAERFQTVYAKVEGAVSAPTSGMHFSRELLKRMEIKGVELAEITMHTGLGTFRTIDVEDLSKHRMDAEEMMIGERAVKIVNEAKDKGKRICAVGTTTTRAVESAVSAERYLKTFNGWTNLFIHPPHDFCVPNAMLTNFHQPKSSLLIMTAAFGGYDLIMKAYEVAIKEKYKFLTYGDAMLIL
ncbi:MAG: tRNA preQ1(34) S-adenosylmethionine ribosyltransferase-isomerase QueA [Bacteroidetes bacterium]|nr:tRNA preQ1(34) S-adenosylmethionine ribosyltransferase-isomerase QueA [Bacteroidota bacterium]MBK8657822.1 tRNA preQ1(34) S-adenosylmethionine ribosyltransferase-isomerase QueA [Bacteroidota bacterium]